MTRDRVNRTIGYFTTKAGYTIEYSIVGKGEPLLMMHGGHSNCREELGYREFYEHGYSVITPSRPGYGKTSKELGENLSVACDAYKELLDHLCIDQVHLIAISAGGPSGINFVTSYPQQVRSLVLQSAVTRRWLTPADKLYKSAQIMFNPSLEKYVWAMMRTMNYFFPKLIFKSMIGSFSQLPTSEVLNQTNEHDLEQFSNMLKDQRSGHGFLIDLVQTGKQLDHELSAIRCPTLNMHSIHDASVPIDHARFAHEVILSSQLCELNSWGHLIWLGEDSAEMYRKLFVFLDKH
ncbi:alpha/beta hydrolase [Paenibacillus cellulositrophicus]|uniref:alpha/beta fold hydrolase n=1 Tax=Paenibacillus cellulositrophicus TaxID=562959 RepID=UPI00203CAF79|nr:alpha/beta hydrolase [Paenibacillus cellulositrophicus]MCM2998311.1 alpha/beta hydrolase [Paenibacillus cellulositrophicus]